MKISKILLTGALALLVASLALPTFAKEKDDKTVTIKGEAKCGKCALHESKSCETVIQSEKDGKTTTYHLAPNDTAKAFHENVCETSKKVTATGTLSTVDGKEVLTATKIEETK